VPVANIGRADYNDIVIGEPSVSTTHAKLQRRDDVWVLTDLGSTNGTFVEGEPVTGDTALTPGTTLRFGEVSVLFEPLDDRPSPRPAATEVMARVEPSAAEPAVEEEPRPVRPRRPIRATAPKPSGPPAWLIAALMLGGMIAAYFFLTTS
jgi:pSer/pThr/pTyr-binding forkhead associated (FHA) protein